METVILIPVYIIAFLGASWLAMTMRYEIRKEIKKGQVRKRRKKEK